MFCASAAALPQSQTRPGAAPAAQSQPPPSQFRVIRSLCGSKGISRGPEFEIEDPRCVFHVPEDRQIIVYFEWEGPPGSHHAEGSWRSPDGKVALTSDFDLTSQGTRYTGTWRLAIPESIAPGLWALEAQIDGLPAGAQTFEIISNRSETPPSPAEVYQRAAAASVFLTSLDADGEPITYGFGFFIANNTVLTAFQVINGANAVQVDLPDGSHATLKEVIAWNRRQDWALLKVESGKAQPLEKAAPNSWKVGDLCYVLSSQGQGSRTIQTVNITGLQGATPSEVRLTISSLGTARTLGAPLLDAYGRAVGVLGGGPVPMSGRRIGSLMTLVDPREGSATTSGPTGLPLAAIPEGAASQQPVTFADLTARSVFTIPLVRNPQAAFGQLCANFRKVGDAIQPLGWSNQFSRKQGTLGVVITWGPNQKVKSVQQVRIYDAENRAVLQTEPAKIELRPQVTAYSAWKLSLSPLPPGVYRVDLLLGDQPQWRQFFRLSD